MTHWERTPANDRWRLVPPPADAPAYITDDLISHCDDPAIIAAWLVSMWGSAPPPLAELLAKPGDGINHDVPTEQCRCTWRCTGCTRDAQWHVHDGKPCERHPAAATGYRPPAVKTIQEL